MMSKASIQRTTKRSWFKEVFLSRNERRLRAGWRILIHLLLLLVFAQISSIIFGILEDLLVAAHWLTPGPEGRNSPGDLLLDGLWIAVTVSSATLLSRRFIDRRSFKSLGF